MNQTAQRNFILIILIVLGAVVLSVFFWPEWTELKIRLGILFVAISFSVIVRERPLLKPRPQRIKQEDPYTIERDRLKKWADSWR